MENQEQGLPVNFSLNDARDMDCECGSKIFITGYRFKKISRIITGGDKDSVMPIEMYLCATCGKALQELLPEELRDTKVIQ
jgi:DNA-directed RNA polymerase subunit RPC12/RpoP